MKALQENCVKNKIGIFTILVETDAEGKNHMINCIDGKVGTLGTAIAIAVSENPIMEVSVMTILMLKNEGIKSSERVDLQ